ncbi:MAG: class I SAM-dependent methyltransferase [Candidatus Tectimicrobiota bacterium]
MPTHQEIGGMSDEQLLQRMVTSHAERFGESFWQFLSSEVLPRVPPSPVVMDLGCGPGLFLQDVAARYTPAALYGYDVTPAMIQHAQQLTYRGLTPTLAIHDLTAAPLPVAAGSVHLIHMSAVLHVLDDPMPVLAEIQRLLAPGGVFVLNDWVRSSLEAYVTSRTDLNAADPVAERRRVFRLFPAHNKYTADDWHWLLRTHGFHVHRAVQLRPHFQVFVTTPMAGH